MHITLIKPNIGRKEHSLYVDEGRMEPLQLGVLAALTPPEVTVRLADDRMEPIPYDAPTDLAVLTVETFTARRAYEIAAEYRRRGVPVLLGGMHVKLLPEEAAAHADAIYLGDAESHWGEVVSDLGQGRLKPVYHGLVGKPQQYVLTRRDLFRGKGELPLTLLQFSRGCRHRCAFCATSAYFQSSHHVRDVAAVAAEIQAAGKRFFFFVDDNIVSDREAAKALFRALIPLKIRWVSQGGIDMTEDRELMDLMVKSGCLGNVIGFESLRPEALAAMNKGPALALGGQYRRALAVLRDYGLQTWAAFTLGHDTDTLQDVERTLEFALENKFAFAAFNILMPYPGTPLYEQLRQEGRLLYGGRWWLHPDYRFNHAAFVPRHMTPDQLTEATFKARSAFNSPASILARAFDLKTNMRSPLRLGIYAAYNPLFRKEVFKKQGLRLGLEPSGEGED